MLLNRAGRFHFAGIRAPLPRMYGRPQRHLLCLTTGKHIRKYATGKSITNGPGSSDGNRNGSNDGNGNDSNDGNGTGTKGNDTEGVMDEQYSAQKFQAMMKSSTEQGFKKFKEELKTELGNKLKKEFGDTSAGVEDLRSWFQWIMGTFGLAGQKTQQKHSPLPPAETEKKQKFLDLTERGKSDDIAHGSIIRVFTIAMKAVFYDTKVEEKVLQKIDRAEEKVTKMVEGSEQKVTKMVEASEKKSD